MRSNLPVGGQFQSLALACCLMQVQKVTDDYIRDVTAMCEAKEAELRT